MGLDGKATLQSGFKRTRRGEFGKAILLEEKSVIQRIQTTHESGEKDVLATR